ncbi:MAG: hypothetical protein ACRDO7_05535 [Nocardioidaceae bacterium]
MKRIASAGAVLAFGMLPVVGLAGPAHGAEASATEVSTDVTAQFCGLDRVRQSYTNCAPTGMYVELAFYDSVQNAASTAQVCVPPGETSIFALLGPYRLAYSSFESIPC